MEPIRLKALGSMSGEERGTFEYYGWVYHIGTNSIGHEYCHLRFLFIRGKHIEMYKRDPHENPGIKSIRKGVIGPAFMVENLGRRRVHQGDVYVLRFFNRLDDAKKGEIACATAGEAQKWMDAFAQAKQQAEYEISRVGSTSARHKLNLETEINLDGHRPRVRRYAHGLRKLIRIGQGPEMLLRNSSTLSANGKHDGLFDGDEGDAIEAHRWKCVRTINGVRILEDVFDQKGGKGALVKSLGVIDASAETVFDMILNLNRQQRYEWDTLTGDLQLIDSYDGHCDVVYGTYDPKYLSRWQSKRDFVFWRQWFCGQDGAYTILQLPAIHKKCPPKSGYRRTKINPSTWEIKSLDSPVSSKGAKCIVTQMLEIHSSGWGKWKQDSNSKFQKSIPYALLCQVAGLKEYIGANPGVKCESSATAVHSKTTSNDESDEEMQDEFYDAIEDDESLPSSSSSSSSESDTDDENDEKVKLKNVSWALTNLAMKRKTAADTDKELDCGVAPIDINPDEYHGSMSQGKDDKDSNCWTSPTGLGFMIRGKNYLKDSSKVMGGDPLLTLIAVDWFKVDKAADKVALHPKCLLQSEAGKKLPFVFVVNLQIPAKPNYSMVLYYAADRPVNKNSLLGKFVDGTDAFRDTRFKLIPSIVEGYWMVKRAVGTKACLLGKAVTCKYLRQDNFLEIDVDIGSSSVARSVIGLVLGYVTSLIVDLAILIEAKEAEELPEYILGTVRLNRVRVDTAVHLGV